MPKTPRSPEEIEQIRRNIMDHALELITKEGFEGFTMRKLAGRLGIAAKTIYNYFQNKDELYLCLLTKGFQQLYECSVKAVEPHTDPADKLKAAAAAYVEFGLENPNIYNLMFTWQVPKYNDYVGTPMEKVAQHELETARKNPEFTRDLVREYLGDSVSINDEEIQIELLHNWTHLHGYVSGINNDLLEYVIENPLSQKQQVIDRSFRNFKLALADYS